jgi:outer membrane autotransporter protein
MAPPTSGPTAGSGSVVVAGAGSAWSVTNTLTLGTGARGLGTGGRLELADGGSVIVGGGTGTVVLGGGTGQAIGELVLGTGAGSFDAGQVTLGGTALVRFDHGSTGYTVDAAFGGTGTLSVDSGVTILTADSSAFDGDTSVVGGALIVDGKLGGLLDVGQTGTLGGIGTVGETMLAGVLSPGRSIGTLTVDGDLTFDVNSSYIVEANPNGDADRVDVLGTATLNSASVDVRAGSGSFAPTTDYTILTATGGVNGTFGTVTSNLAFLDPSLTHNPNSVVLRLTRNTTGFDTIGGTLNQMATGGGTEPLGPGNPVYDAVLPLDQPGALAAFDLLSGEIHASLKGVLAADSSLVRGAILEQLAEAFDGDARMASPSIGNLEIGPDRTVWAKAVGAVDRWTGGGNAADIGHGAGAMLIGADGLVGDWRVGLMAGIGGTGISIDDRNSTMKSTDYHFGVYAGRDIEQFRLRFGTLQTFSDVDATRNIGFGTFTDMLTASYGVSTTQVFGDVGYGIDVGEVEIEPFVALALVHVGTAGFTEAGGPAALSSAGPNFGAAFSTVGVRIATEFVLGDDMLVTARGSVGWRHAFAATPTANVAYAMGTPFSIAGVPLAADSLLVSGGIDMAIAPGVNVGLTYAGQYGSNVVSHSVKAGVWAEF